MRLEPLTVRETGKFFHKIIDTDTIIKAEDGEGGDKMMDLGEW